MPVGSATVRCVGILQNTGSDTKRCGTSGVTATAGDGYTNTISAPRLYLRAPLDDGDQRARESPNYARAELVVVSRSTSATEKIGSARIIPCASPGKAWQSYEKM